jgi:hypothetical protein
MNQGIRTSIYPVKDAQRAATLFRKLLNAEPFVEPPYYVGFRIADQGIDLEPISRSKTSAPASQSR